MIAKKKDFSDLKQIVSRLRGKDGCPWDREQTESTIKNYLLEETYEIIQAIENNDSENLKEELGDVLFQILFLAELSEEKEHFDIYDAITHACEKFVRRHPHVFKDESAETLTSGEVVKLWDNIKKGEKKKDDRDILKDIPKILPALLRAYEVSKKVSKAGFDWEQSTQVIDKINEEMAELKEAIKNEHSDNIEEELGDVLFTVVNLCRFLKVNPENALNRTTNKFIKRFEHVQKRAGYDLSKVDMSTLESFWNEAKEKAKNEKK